jgi:hypothetical protein
MAVLGTAPSYGKHPNAAWFITGVAVFGIGAIVYLIGLIGPRVGKWAILRKTVESTRSHPTPGFLTTHATVSNGLVIDPYSESPKTKVMAHSEMHAGFKSGNLPVNITTEGPSGQRDTPGQWGESWTWDYKNVTFVNESDEYITFHAWLVVDVSHQVTVRELKPSPDRPISLLPHETKVDRFVFRLDMIGWTDDQVLHPGKPRELLLLEDGSKGRKLLVNYELRESK